MVRQYVTLFTVLGVYLVACGAPPDSADGSSGSGLGRAHPDRPDPSSTPEDADTDTDTGTDTDTDTGSAPGGGGAGAPIRFIALGDAGTGGSEQYAVADAIATVCAAHGCDFALYLGDNIYDDGVSGADDAQWAEKFEQPYAALEFPFYAALGNHDYGAGGGGFEIDRANAQVEYASRSDKFVMPATFYSHVQGDATFIALDTTALDWGRSDEQQAWLPGVIADADTQWKIAYGHHPYISNGDHGNANDNFGPFFEDNLCGQVDVYFCGHDHHLEWLEPTCGTEFIISGAGAKLRGVGGSNPDFYAASQLGFMWVEIDGNTFTGVYYDDNGDELYRRSFQK